MFVALAVFFGYEIPSVIVIVCTKLKNYDKKIHLRACFDSGSLFGYRQCRGKYLAVVIWEEGKR